MDGACGVDHYGLRVAEMSSMPRQLLDAAWDIARKVEARDIAAMNASSAVERSGGGGGGGARAGAGSAGPGEIISEEEEEDDEDGGRGVRRKSRNRSVEQTRRVAIIAQRVSMICESLHSSSSSVSASAAPAALAHVGGGSSSRLSAPPPPMNPASNPTLKQPKPPGDREMSALRQLQAQARNLLSFPDPDEPRA